MDQVMVQRREEMRENIIEGLKQTVSSTEDKLQELEGEVQHKVGEI
jgi:hypothetical protein